MENKKRRQKSCAEIALMQASQARRQKKHPILIGWVFIAALLSIRSSISAPSIAQTDTAADGWPISDYERGFPTLPKPSRERYREQPTIRRLMRDLRRPASRDEAMKFLMTRIDNVALRGWVIEQVCEDRINRLATHVRRDMKDNAIIASWQAELDAENAAVDEVINDDVQVHQPSRH